MENQQISVASKREKQCFFFPSSFCVQEQSSMFHPPPPNTVCLILILLQRPFPIYIAIPPFVFSFCYLKQKDDNKYKLKYKENVRRIDGNRHLVEAMNNLETKLNTLMKCLKQLQ